MIDGDSVVARLCAAGMAIDGDAVAAGALFRQAWDARRDDGYRDFVSRGLQRVCARIAQAASPVADI